MKKRVYGSRIGLCTVLMALFVIAIVTVVPVSARENMSVGQAGDPGDGSEVDNTGGSVVGVTGSNVQSAENRSELVSILVPIWVGGILVFHIVVLSARRLTGQ